MGRLYSKESEAGWQVIDLDFPALAERSHALAVEKGWWPGIMVTSDRIDEAVTLIASELFEALDEYRNGVPLAEIRYSETGKPEGYVVELADVIIRCADLAGRLCMADKVHLADKRFDDEPVILSPVRMVRIAAEHALVTHTPIGYVDDTVAIVCMHCDALGLPLAEAIEIKHAYNRTRPHRHGGKVI